MDEDPRKEGPQRISHFNPRFGRLFQRQGLQGVECFG
ncbi:hypothetical protein CULC0102_0470 [Corynebacterium ulcerans 0102]|nr:hypothetical protein CULC0102_0470 [Corynebacterium ulcerans 0102]